MSDERVRVFVEDDDRLGPDFYRARTVRRAEMWFDPILQQGLMELPEDLVRQWEEARDAWERAKAEMRSLLKERRKEVVEAVGGFAGYEAAIRADQRSRRR